MFITKQLFQSHDISKLMTPIESDFISLKHVHVLSHFPVYHQIIKTKTSKFVNRTQFFCDLGMNGVKLRDGGQ